MSLLLRASRSDTTDSAFGGMIAFCIIIGDSIPHVITAVVPKIDEMPVLWLLANRRAVIIITTMGISYPLTLYRDISKVRHSAAVQTISLLMD
jgi:sodium-coupled neutral amino acid transporter 11